MKANCAFHFSWKLRLFFSFLNSLVDTWPEPVTIGLELSYHQSHGAKAEQKGGVEEIQYLSYGFGQRAVVF